MSWKNSSSYRDLAQFIKEDSEFRIVYSDKYPEIDGYTQENYENKVDDFMGDLTGVYDTDSLTLDKEYLDICWYKTGNLIFNVDEIFDYWKSCINE